MGADLGSDWAPKKPFVPVRTIGKYISLYSAILCMATKASKNKEKKVRGIWVDTELAGTPLECSNGYGFDGDYCTTENGTPIQDY